MPFVPLMERPSVKQRISSFDGLWIGLWLSAFWTAYGVIDLAVDHPWWGVFQLGLGVSYIATAVTTRKATQRKLADRSPNDLYRGLATLEVPWQRFTSSTIRGILTISTDEISWALIANRPKPKYAGFAFASSWADLTDVTLLPSTGSRATLVVEDVTGAVHKIVTRQAPDVETALSASRGPDRLLAAGPDIHR